MLTAVLVILVATLAFTARQTPPPAIAEFAPQAQHQITKAPSQLSSSLGNAPGAPGGVGGATTTTTSTTLPLPPGALPPTSTTTTIPPNAVTHHCYGNPPRQIQDTQSPPCVPYWVGNNGGATATGVTTDSIKVLTYYPTNGGPDAQRVITDLENFFNQNFEFYGRKLNVVTVKSTAASNSCSNETAAADAAVQANHPFATDPAGNACFQIETARDHTIVVDGGAPTAFNQAEFASFAPYLWNYQMSYDNAFATVGKFACSELAGQKATHSSDPTIASKPRKFGLIDEYDQTPYPMSTSYLKNALKACGIQLAAEDDWMNPESNDTDQELVNFSESAVTDMHKNGVTTVLCFCSVIATTPIPVDAQGQGYFPEWVLTYGDMDWNELVKAYWTEPSERTSLMAISFEPREMPYPDSTVNQALEQVDPGFSVATNPYYIDAQDFYWFLLHIASGIQMAGPDLTPYTFEKGLQAASFPNPYSSAQEGSVGFLGNSFTMTTDATAMWWSDSQPSPYTDEGSGTYCYMDAGERFSASNWPWSGPQPLFTPNCVS